jgi:hypothetical protein
LSTPTADLRSSELAANPIGQHWNFPAGPLQASGATPAISRAAPAAALVFSAAAFSAQAEQVGESAAPSDVFASSIALTQGVAGAGGAGSPASSATGSAFAYDLSVSRSQLAGLESSIALSNNASAQDDAGAVFGASRLAAR